MRDCKHKEEERKSYNKGWRWPRVVEEAGGREEEN